MNLTPETTWLTITEASKWLANKHSIVLSNPALRNHLRGSTKPTLTGKFEPTPTGGYWMLTQATVDQFAADYLEAAKTNHKLNLPQRRGKDKVKGVRPVK